MSNAAKKVNILPHAFQPFYDERPLAKKILLGLGIMLKVNQKFPQPVVSL